MELTSSLFESVPFSCQGIAGRGSFVTLSFQTGLGFQEETFHLPSMLLNDLDIDYESNPEDFDLNKLTSLPPVNPVALKHQLSNIATAVF